MWLRIDLFEDEAGRPFPQSARALAAFVPSPTWCLVVVPRHRDFRQHKSHASKTTCYIDLEGFVHWVNWRPPCQADDQRSH